MSLGAIGTGALIGTAAGSAIGMLTRNPKDFAKWALTGLVTGVALGAIALFAGQAATIGASFCLCVAALITNDSDHIAKVVFYSAAILFGTAVGYPFGLIG